MIVTIDNFEGAGARDYTPMVESSRAPKIARKLNRPSKAQLSLVSDDPQFVVPASGGRIKISNSDGHAYFTGYLISEPAFEYLGWGQSGPVHRYAIEAVSDEWALDRKRVPSRPSFVARTVGSALKQITEDILPGAFDTAEVQDIESQPVFASARSGVGQNLRGRWLSARAVFAEHTMERSV